MFRFKSDNDLSFFGPTTRLADKKSPAAQNKSRNKLIKLNSPHCFEPKNHNKSNSSTPDKMNTNSKMLPKIMRTKSAYLKNHETSIDEQSINECDCFLCIENNLKNHFCLNRKDFLILDSRNFISCINTMKPTIKIERENIMGTFPDENNKSTGTKQRSSSDNRAQERAKVLSAKSRVKLWNQEEVMNVISNEILNLDKSVVTKKQTQDFSDPRETVSALKKKYLSNIYEDFSADSIYNRSKTPFYNKMRSEKIIRNNNASNNNNSSGYPTAPPVTPIAYRVPMNSAQSFYPVN